MDSKSSRRKNCIYTIVGEFYQLIESVGAFHNNQGAGVVVLEEGLIKPVFNFVLFREKAKDTFESAQILYNEWKYSDLADRCYYAMIFTLKALLERKGKFLNIELNI